MKPVNFAINQTKLENKKLITNKLYILPLILLIILVGFDFYKVRLDNKEFDNYIDLDVYNKIENENLLLEKEINKLEVYEEFYHYLDESKEREDNIVNIINTSLEKDNNNRFMDSISYSRGGQLKYQGLTNNKNEIYDLTEIINNSINTEIKIYEISLTDGYYKFVLGEVNTKNVKED